MLDCRWMRNHGSALPEDSYGVTWDGHAGGGGCPSLEWLSAFWGFVDARKQEDTRLFSNWPLLPTTAGQLCYVAYQHMVFVPPPGLQDELDRSQREAEAGWASFDAGDGTTDLAADAAARVPVEAGFSDPGSDSDGESDTAEASLIVPPVDNQSAARAVSAFPGSPGWPSAGASGASPEPPPVFGSPHRIIRVAPPPPPPLDALASFASAATEIVGEVLAPRRLQRPESMGAVWGWLEPLLDRVRAPVLDTKRFPQCADACALLPEWAEYTPADIVLQKLVRWKQVAGRHLALTVRRVVPFLPR